MSLHDEVDAALTEAGGKLTDANAVVHALKSLKIKVHSTETRLRYLKDLDPKLLSDQAVLELGALEDELAVLVAELYKFQDKPMPVVPKPKKVVKDVWEAKK